MQSRTISTVYCACTCTRESKQASKKESLVKMHCYSCTTTLDRAIDLATLPGRTFMQTKITHVRGTVQITSIRIVSLHYYAITPPSNPLAYPNSSQIIHFQLPFLRSSSISVVSRSQSSPQKAIQPRNSKSYKAKRAAVVCTKWRELPQLYLAE